ncbi:MAG: hypothetical protein IH971_08480 [Candidatus Marinimicrobia bacterium]|nr:hypothetical protein [Candidatus Neomarinimicrobiota bacterium]
MADAGSDSSGPAPAYAWIILTLLGMVLALSAVYILSTGMDPSDFEGATALEWDTFNRSYPEVGIYLMRLERLTGAVMLGFALFAAMVSYGPFRRGNRWAWATLWIVPLALGLVTGVFLTHGAGELGGFYGGLAVLVVLMLVLPYRAFFPR